MNFASDNTAGVAPEIMQALVSGNDGFALGYGNDDLTRSCLLYTSDAADE